LAILTEILAVAPATKVIIATGNETREHALRAIALGAYDFIKTDQYRCSPIDCSRAGQMFELEAENRRLLEAALASPIDGIIASAEMLTCSAPSKNRADRRRGTAARRERNRQGAARSGDP
jgi:two-component system NtrC family response regulator